MYVCANVVFFHMISYIYMYMLLFILFGKLDKRQHNPYPIYQRHRYQLMASCKCYNTSAEQSHSQNELLFVVFQLCLVAFFLARFVGLHASFLRYFIILFLFFYLSRCQKNKIELLNLR